MVVCKTKPTLNCFSYNCLQKQLSTLGSSNTAFANMSVSFVCLFVSFFVFTFVKIVWTKPCNKKTSL